MKTVIGQVAAQMPADTIAVTEIDVSTDEALERIYAQEIPVLLVDGRKSAKYRITEEELKRILRVRFKTPSRRPGRSAWRAPVGPGREF